MRPGLIIYLLLVIRTIEETSVLNLKTNILKAAFAFFVIGTLMIATLPSPAYAQGLKVVSGSPGDTILFSGTAKPDSKVRLEISTVVSINTYISGDKCLYRSDTMKNVNLSGDNSMSITVSPVDTLTVSSSAMGIDRPADGFISGHTGTFSMDLPAGTCDIAVSGIANASASSVSMTIRDTRFQNVDRYGKYTVSINTSGLPSTIYTVTQDGNIVARIYLGVQAPATPTPTHLPSPSTAGTPGPGVSGDINATQPPSDNATGAWALYVLLMVFGSIIGVAAAYLFVVKKH